MSTHASIWMRNSDGKVSGIYCHFDGYLSHVGKILETYYADTEKVKALIDLGDISYLGNTLEIKNGPHVSNDVNRNDDKNRYTAPYGGSPSFADDTDAILRDWKQEFNYFWNGKDWLYYDGIKWGYLRNELTESKSADDVKPVSTGWVDNVVEVRTHEEKVSDLFKHELLDRISIINHLFNDIIIDHPAAKLLTPEKLKAAGEAIADLYQDAGTMRFEEK